MIQTTTSARPDIVIGQSAETLADRYHYLPPPDPGKPRVVFPSNLRLTQEREDALCRYAHQRFTDLSQELGRDVTEVNFDGLPQFLRSQDKDARAEQRFMSKRMLYQHISENDFTWRKHLMPRSIFAKSNLIVPLVRRIARQMAARATNYFFGTDPWIAVDFVGNTDEKMAKALEKLTITKLLAYGNQDRIRNALATVFNLGEVVMKVVHVRKSEFYRKEQVVAVQDGKPIMGADGLPITQEDEWSQQDGGWMLIRDGSTRVENPAALEFAPLLLDEELVHYQGPSAEPIYFRDFLCPLNAPSVQEADCVVHVVSYSANQLAADYMANPGGNLESLQTAIEAIRMALNHTPELKAAANLRPELQETSAPNNPDPTMPIGEFYIRFDADGDGYMEDIMLVMDLNTLTPIFYDYVANVTDTGLRPFSVERIMPVNNRWYGQGAIEAFESYQTTVDLLVNRRNVSQSEAGTVKFWNPGATLQGEKNPHLVLNGGNTYTLRENKKAEDALEVVPLSDIKFDRLTEEIQFFLQLAMNESGVQHANDNYVAGMDSAKLATGIRNIEKSGMELFGVYISDLETGLNHLANAFVTCLHKNLDDEETFIFFEGDVPVELTIKKRDVKNFALNVRVTLSRYKAEQSLVSAGEAITIVRDFISLPPQAQLDMAPLYIAQLEALQVRNPERYIKPLAYSVPLTGTPGAAPQPADAQPLAPPPNL